MLDSRHGWERGGSEGPAIVPGKPDESLLLKAVRYENYEMPPEEKLPDGEIALLEKWIAMGCPTRANREHRRSIPNSSGRFQPIAKPPVPTVRDSSGLGTISTPSSLPGLRRKGLARPATPIATRGCASDVRSHGFAADPRKLKRL